MASFLYTPLLILLRGCQMDTKEIFLLNIKKFILIFAVWIVFVILHNLISGSFGIDEKGFLIITTIIIPVYFIISAVYSFFFFIFIILHKKKKKKKKTKKKEKIS